MSHPSGRSFGIVGGLGALAGADLYLKLAQAAPAAGGADQLDILLEQHPFPGSLLGGAAEASQTARKLYVFDMVQSFHKRGVEAILLPCFISHTFLEELKPELQTPVLSLMEALKAHVARRFPTAVRLGVLTSDYVLRDGMFARAFPLPRHVLVLPRPEAQADLMTAIYAPGGLKAGGLNGDAVPLLRRACRDLADQGAEVILPGFTEIPLVLDALADSPAPLVDCNRVYAQYATDHLEGAAPRPCRIGVVGGVGPAATVDFLGKIVRNTHARVDQEHLKLVVEQNPQIPDRTANLVAGGVDPTVALYAACKKLEASGADLIAIPCNTAHAFVDRIQPYLGIPIINMLRETIEHLRVAHAGKTIGLLATDGTVKSGIYQQAARAADLELIVPDAPFQKRVMEAIYGPSGIKSGFTTGQCRDDFNRAVEHLVDDKGADVVILGCTELPLVAPGSGECRILGRTVAFVDPTEVLARKCISFAEAFPGFQIGTGA